MRNTKGLISTVIAAALFGPALATADNFEVVNGEAGIIFRDPPSTATREQVRAELKFDKVAGAWTNVGGEAGWKLSGARYVFEGGKLAHAANCPLITAAATKIGPGSDSKVSPVYSGA